MTKSDPENTEASAWTTLSAFRISRATVTKLDAWLERQNEGRRGPKLTRNDLIRGLLDWAGDTHPDWEARPSSSAPQPEPPPAPQPPAPKPKRSRKA